MKSLLTATITSLYICTACVKEIDTPSFSTTDKLALNGILHPDSMVRVTLTRLLPTWQTDNRFLPIEDASMYLLEDGKSVGMFSYQDEAYLLDYYPQVGKLYTIEAEVEGYGLIRASDAIPVLPKLTACYKQELDYQFASTAVEVSIDNANEANYYWLDLLIKQYERLGFGSRICKETNEGTICSRYDSSKVIIEQLTIPKSFSTIPDGFNSIVDNTSGGIRDYDNYIRIDNSTINSASVTLDITGGFPLFRFDEMSQLDSNQSLILHAISASQAYDRYLKSSFIYYLNNEFYDTPNPFAEPTQIYSNVENGIGIFAAYNSVSIAVEDHPCP